VSENYTEESIKSLDWRAHIRLRPGMYIGKLGDGSSSDDGIYILLKEIIDNAVDEYLMGYGKKIEISLSDHEVSVRDYGRGIPLGKVVACVSMINTGAKYDSSVFQKSVGLNGVGTKAVNALSEQFLVRSVRDGQEKSASFQYGELCDDPEVAPSSQKNGTFVSFVPDKTMFKGYRFRPELLDDLLWHYAHLNVGLTLKLNNSVFKSQNGLADYLNKKLHAIESVYEPVHIVSKDIEVAFVHGSSQGEMCYSFVNGQYTPMGGTHHQSFRESFVRTVRDFYGKKFEVQDIKNGLIVALCVRIQEPVFESQTKTRLGSQVVVEGGMSLKAWFHSFFGKELDLRLHQNKEFAEAMAKKIRLSQQERSELSSIKKVARERIKKTDLYNKKLRDCKFHFNDAKRGGEHSMLFVTEGDSASGSITKSRDPKCQAVFSLRGKPLNTFGMKKRVVYENEELYLLAHACRLEEGLEHLRYHKIILATDADVDGMHIRLLLLTFFLTFYPEVVQAGHLHVLETPLFRVRHKKNTIYCYSDQQKEQACKKLGGSSKSQKSVEITRFKGLGEISPDEFCHFIGKDMRLSQVNYDPEKSPLSELLAFFMGKNTQERKQFIVSHLRDRDILLQA